MDAIVIRGARQHNLKNVSVAIPRNKLVVVTGVSGSGKSTLAFDVLDAEGRRRYVESLSAYARQFLAQRAKPQVDAIEGLSPTLGITHQAAIHSPRSTVGTASEIADSLRVLYARAGTPHCLECGRVIERHGVPQIVDRLLNLPAGSRIQLLAPLRSDGGKERAAALQELRRAGFVRVRINGRIHDLADDIPPAPSARSDAETHRDVLEVVVDRLIVKPDVAPRLADSLDTALRYGRDVVNVLIDDGRNGATERRFTQRLMCPECEFAYPELSPAFFSANSPEGACPDCDGLGVRLPKATPRRGRPQGSKVQPRTCDTCDGGRLRAETRGIVVGGACLADLNRRTLAETSEFFSSLALPGPAAEIAQPLLDEVVPRLAALIELGLGYLTLDRAMSSLSRGEVQRVRLANLLGNGLSGVVYVLDEPSVGLHARDTARLLALLGRLRDRGNTVVVVEHDPETIRAADYVIDLGPEAGERGGRICATGTFADIAGAPESVTGRFLSGAEKIAVPRSRRSAATWLKLSRVRRHNLKDVSIALPLGALTCVSGVSGSGKSSLIGGALLPALNDALAGTKSAPAGAGRVSGWQHVDKIIAVDRAPIGRTPASTPATYTGLLDTLRGLYARLPDARMRGYGRNRFSFNVKGGRCEACEGNGVLAVEMNFLPDVYVTCDVCRGQRYNRDTLAIRFRGHSVADALDMTVAEALALFSDIPKMRVGLETLRDVGLAYLRLGQAAPTLSDGEVQRLKLAKELSRKATGRTLFVFDEPTVGLHLADVQRLLAVFELLVEAGNTLVVIEHNLEVVKTADWVIDLGPESGAAGGEVIACGTPEDVAQVEVSQTGWFLKPLLQKA